MSARTRWRQARTDPLCEHFTPSRPYPAAELASNDWMMPTTVPSKPRSGPSVAIALKTRRLARWSPKRAGARVLAVEADKTILLDQADVVALADRYGISIVARTNEVNHPAVIQAPRSSLARRACQSRCGCSGPVRAARGGRSVHRDGRARSFHPRAVNWIAKDRDGRTQRLVR